MPPIQGQGRSFRREPLITRFQEHQTYRRPLPDPGIPASASGTVSLPIHLFVLLMVPAPLFSVSSGLLSCVGEWERTALSSQSQSPRHARRQRLVSRAHNDIDGGNGATERT
ncbi:hypothetical protein AAFF_G00072900 [Aldrovandia affinis]|uniref:Uncharacterized protein n=1 Tax=Aldrovandia affinis TaxID=143900 RepID=A0AAD7S0Y1_9TELE|nr:hypothetical protein AAFF_G00072900 [Aldrovandia affinis]